MKLAHVTDKTLLIDTKKLTSDERKTQLAILYHLKEIDRRKLYSDLKYSSLFDYCVKELKYSESSAQRRIVAARILEVIPEIAPKIESGKLSLTNISQVNQFFKETEKQKEILIQIEGLSKKECEKKLFDLSEEPKKPRDKIKRISKDEVQVAIVLSDETMQALEEMKALVGKNVDMDGLIKMAMNALKEKIEKNKFKQTERPKSLPPEKVGRQVQAYVKREVYKRDKVCTNCGSSHHLNYDHQTAFSLGGSSRSDNIRLLCFQCNQRARIRARL